MCRSSATLAAMAIVPQRELRNNIGEVLRRAEDGERITITVSGRPIAELGPLSGRRPFAPARSLARILTETPVDPNWADELERLRIEDRQVATDPWAD